MNLQVRKNTIAQINYVFINKKWKNSEINCEAYISFEGVSSDHRIVTAKVRLSLLRKASPSVTTKHYDWALLNNRGIRDKYVLALRKKSDALQKTEIRTPNDEYENFINARLEASAKRIPKKLNLEFHGRHQQLEKTCSRENSLQMHEEDPNEHKWPETKNRTKWISKHISKRTDRIHTKSNR